jgi:periplasmic protein TonB
VSGIKFPLALSVAGHVACLTVLALLLAGAPPPVPMPVAMGGIEVVFQPPLPKTEPAPVPEPQVETQTPPPLEEPPEPAAVPEPPPPATEAPVEAKPPPPPHRIVVKRAPKPVVRRPDTPQASPTEPTQPAPVAVAAPQTAFAATPVPAPVPSPQVSAGYDALVSTWLNNHKRYPESARQKGEEGRIVLHFEVERSGRVIDYAVVKSSGYPELDAAIDEMMRGAVLPPFPAGLTQARKEFTVPIHFRLER